MKIFVYNYREFDEAEYFEKFSKEYHVELGICISAHQKAGATFLIMAADTVCCKPNNASNAISANVLFIIYRN